MARKNTEIERKWLVETLPDLSKHRGAKIVQGYLVVSPEGSEVRLRRKDEELFATVKTGDGLKRREIEIELSKKQFQKLWPATQGRRLEKIRYTIKWHGKKIELDIYQKKLAGLRSAEVEFKTRKQAKAFLPPDWFGKEVTEDDEYKNAHLAQRKRKVARR